MSPQIHSVAIVFADISGSTGLYERLGDARARVVVAAFIELMVEATREHGGVVIKTLGDAVLATFRDVQNAVQAACAMQARVVEREAENAVDGRDLGIRVGLHYGAVIEEQSDIFGDAVNVAARMVALAKPDQILTTEQTLSMMDRIDDERARFVEATSVKGKRQILKIYEILPEGKDVERTQMPTVRIPLVDARPRQTTLSLGFRGAQLLLDEKNPVATLGRGPQNDIVVSHSAASRRHGRIELRRGKFLLIDQSTNGTYVQPDSGDCVHVHREEYVLAGHGILGLGRAVGTDSDRAIRYRCTDA
jgi:adenylate cyclase